MKKEDKGLIIGQLTEIVKEYPNFYLTDIEALDAEKTSKLRRECFKKEIKLVVVKNNLLKKGIGKCRRRFFSSAGCNERQYGCDVLTDC